MALILAYEKFMIILTELQKVLSQELKCLSSKGYNNPIRMNCTKNYGYESLTF